VIDDAFAVLRSASIAEQEVEHHCASLEQPSTLADFTHAMILGKSVLPNPHPACFVI